MKERYEHELSWFEKLIGVWRVNTDSFDTKWGYFAPRFGFDLTIGRGGYFDQRYSFTICIIWGCLHTKIPFKTKLEEDCEWPEYGVSFFEDSFIIKYGRESKYIRLPFIAMEFDHHKVIDVNGDWIDYEYENPLTDTETHDYNYQLSSGEVQNRKATCYKEKRQWHRKWFPMLKIIVESIDISFSNEVGEQTGSWKGGCTGCGYDLLPNEDVESCLRRMEKERKF